MTDAPQQGMVLQYRDTPENPATTARNRQALLDALDAIKAGNFDAFWAIFDPEVTFHEAACLPYGGAHRGIEATKRAYAQLSATFSEMRSVMEAVLASHDIVILYQTITFRTAETGRTGTLPVSEVFRFRGGKVVEWRACYFDADMVAKAIQGE